MMRVGPLALLAMLALAGCANAALTGSSLFTVEREIALPDVKGRIDHLAVDVAHHRLFVAEIANGSVDAVDLDSGQTRRITGLSEPQGVAYLPALDQLAVSSGGDGAVRFYKAETLEPVGSVKLGDDADNVRVDPVTGLVAVGYGSGAIALIDPATRNVIRKIALPAHPEAFQIDAEQGRAFVNLPNARSVAMVDLKNGQLLARWHAPHLLNFPMALGAQHESVAIVSRLPTHLSWLDAKSGAVRQDLPTCGDADDVYRDDARRRWYISCGSGTVDVFAERDAAIIRVGAVPTRSGARTSLFVPALDRLFVAVPAGWMGSGAKLMILKPQD
jgi:hypothetical protein